VQAEPGCLVRKLIRGGFVSVKARRITRHSTSRTQGRQKSDPFGGSPKAHPLRVRNQGLGPG
jgi:hypothetical protein